MIFLGPLLCLLSSLIVCITLLKRDDFKVVVRGKHYEALSNPKKSC